MRLSCADSAFPKLSHEVALAVIADLSIPGVDLCLFEGANDPLMRPGSALTDPDAIATTLRRRCEAAGLAAADVFCILGHDFEESAINHPSETVRAYAREMFRACLEIGTGVGAPGVTLLPGVHFADDGPGDSLRRASDELAWRCDAAAAAGLSVSIEAHVGSIVASPRATAELLAAVPNLGLTLDPGHFVMQGYACDDLRVFYDRVRHVQIRQASPGVLQAAVADGIVDLPSLVEGLRSVGYDDWLGLEYQWEDWMGCNRVDCISETALLRDALLAACGTR